MANKYSKANTQSRDSKTAAVKTPNQYEQKRKRLNNGARIMAIIVIAAMVITTFLAAGLFLFD